MPDFLISFKNFLSCVLPMREKCPKYGVFAGPYFPAFGPKKTPYLDTFHAVYLSKLAIPT